MTCATSTVDRDRDVLTVIDLDSRRQTTPARRELVLLLGWGGCQSAQLRRYADWYRAEGHEVEAYAMPIAKARRGALALADLRELLHRVRRSDAPLIVHTFSNMGFVAYATLLSLDEDSGLRERIVAHVVDSGPGLAPQMSAASFAADLSGALLVAARVTSWGRRPHLARLVGACASLALRLHYHLVSEIGGRYGRALRDYAELAPVVPLLSLTGERDLVVSEAQIEAFIEGERARGADVTRVVFRGSEHVNHFRRHPRAYGAALGEFLSSRLTGASARAT